MINTQTEIVTGFNADFKTPVTDVSQPVFFPVSIRKLIVMLICTLSFYQIYWFYKNWQLIKIREKINISPAPRAIFAIFFCHQCFARIKNFDAPAAANSKLAARGLASGWLVLTLLSNISFPYSLLGFFAFIFFIPVQICVNRINTAVSPEHDPNSRFSGWNGAIITLFIIVLILTLIGFARVSK